MRSITEKTSWVQISQGKCLQIEKLKIRQADDGKCNRQLILESVPFDGIYSSITVCLSLLSASIKQKQLQKKAELQKL